MNQGKILRIGLQILMSLVLSILLIPISQVVSQSPLNATNVEEAALAKVTSIPDLLPTGYKPFQVGSVRISGSWAILNLVAFPIDPDPNADLVIPHILFAITHLNDIGDVKVFIETEEPYYDLIPRIPDKLLSPESKSHLLSMPYHTIYAVTTYQIPGLPWQKGVAWRYNQGPHGDGKDAFDFGTPNHTSDWVHAADSGTVVYSTETCMAVKRSSDGLRLWYQHIRPSDIDNFPVGTSVSLDQRLGMTTMESGCGGYSTGHHVHFYFDYYTQPVPSAGSSMNGWVSVDQNLVKGGVTATPNGVSQILYSAPDSIPPTTSKSLSGASGDNGWYTSDVQVTLTASDNSGGSGVKVTQYKIDDGAWQTYTGPITVSGDGRHTVSYRSQDNEGNWESTKQVAVPIDATAPTGSLALNDGATSTPGVLIHINPAASDATSGLHQMRLRDAGGAWSTWQAYDAHALWQLPALTGHSHTVEIQIKDVAGNLSTTYEDAILLDIYPQRPASADYRLARSTWGAAPKDGQSTTYRLRGTVGQPSLIGVLSSAGYRLASGYWSGQGQAGTTHRVYLPLVVRQ
jgi:hypothetical protein